MLRSLVAAQKFVRLKIAAKIAPPCITHARANANSLHFFWGLFSKMRVCTSRGTIFVYARTNCSRIFGSKGCVCVRARGCGSHGGKAKTFRIHVGSVKKVSTQRRERAARKDSPHRSHVRSAGLMMARLKKSAPSVRGPHYSMLRWSCICSYPRKSV